MALETPTYISDLVRTNPTSGDPLSQADDHFRNIKSTLQNTFPNIVGQVNASDAELNDLLTMFVGSVHYFPATSAPSGFLKADGSLVSRTTYANLWAFAQASGNIAASDGAWTEGKFSPGDGTTTFRVPNLRGRFVRAADDGRGLDSGRTVGSSQTDDFKSHTHAQAAHQHAINHKNSGTSASGSGLLRGTDTDGASTSFMDAQAPAIAATGGTETRPANIALLACIKY